MIHAVKHEYYKGTLTGQNQRLSEAQRQALVLFLGDKIDDLLGSINEVTPTISNMKNSKTVNAKEILEDVLFLMSEHV